MKKFVFIYHSKGSMSGKPSPEESKKITDKWMAWFGSIHDKLVDGGNPFASHAKSVSTNGIEAVERDPATGYTIINAKDMDEATEIAKGCPVLEDGGEVRVYEAMPM